jgi:tRNA-splicing ligase RtcB
MLGARDFKKIGDFLYEIPTSHRPDMRVPARFYADDRLLEGITGIAASSSW